MKNLIYLRSDQSAGNLSVVMLLRSCPNRLHMGLARLSVCLSHMGF